MDGCGCSIYGCQGPQPFGGPQLVSIADIKKDLPDWPDDVVDQWLLYFANQPNCGWPPSDPLGNHRWSGVLGARPLSWWKKVSWTKETVNCSLTSLSHKSTAIVKELSAAFIKKTADPVTARRIKHAYHYIMDNAVFPKPVITMKVSTGLQVLDGSHRMAAFLYFANDTGGVIYKVEQTKGVAQTGGMDRNARRRRSASNLDVHDTTCMMDVVVLIHLTLPLCISRKCASIFETE